jgi:ribonucleotide reductase beta subunit family protein with ferritin-like domain
MNIYEKGTLNFWIWFAIKLSSDFYKVQVSTDYEENILKCIVLSFALLSIVTPDTILPS